MCCIELSSWWPLSWPHHWLAQFTATPDKCEWLWTGSHWTKKGGQFKSMPVQSEQVHHATHIQALVGHTCASKKTNIFRDFHFSTCFMPFPSKKTKKKMFDRKFSKSRVQNFLLGQKIFFRDFHFSRPYTQFPTQKTKKKIFYQIFWNFNAPQIARIQNFEILISPDDEYYLED